MRADPPKAGMCAGDVDVDCGGGGKDIGQRSPPHRWGRRFVVMSHS
jgi:hypothetical protein